jgi:hypothetical protein
VVPTINGQLQRENSENKHIGVKVEGENVNQSEEIIEEPLAHIEHVEQIDDGAATQEPVAEPAGESAPVIEEAAPVESAPVAPVVESPEELEAKKELAQKGLITAVMSERRKRQEAEAKLQSILQQQQPQDYYQDPQQQPAQPQNQEWKTALMAMSEVQAKAAHSDYDEKLAAFTEHINATKDASLWAQIENAVHPAEAAYQFGKSLLIQKKYGSDPEQMAAKIRAEVEQEIRAKQAKAIGEKVAAKNNSTTNLSTVRTAASGGATAQWKPTTIADLYRS